MSSSAAATGQAPKQKKPSINYWDVVTPENMAKWEHQKPAANKQKNTLGYINLNGNSQEHPSIQFGSLNAWPEYRRIKGIAEYDPTRHFICTFPFGISEPYGEENAGKTRRNLECQYPKTATQATAKLEQLEEHIVEVNVAHAKEWFPESFQPDDKEYAKWLKASAHEPEIQALKDNPVAYREAVIQHHVVEKMRDKFKSTIFMDKTGKYDPKWRVKIEMGAKGLVELLSIERDPVTGKERIVRSPGSTDDIKPWSRGIVIFEMSPGTYYQADKWGPSQSATAVLLLPASKAEKGAFEGLDDDDDIGQASVPVDRSQFVGVNPEEAAAQAEMSAGEGPIQAEDPAEASEFASDEVAASVPLAESKKRRHSVETDEPQEPAAAAASSAAVPKKKSRKTEE